MIEQVGEDRFSRAVRLNGRLMALHVTPAATPERIHQPRLRVAVLGDEAAESDLPAALALARHIFNTDDDLTGFVAVAAADPVLGRVAQRYIGLRPVLIADPFEALVWAILGQQINIGFAGTLKRRLVERFGGVLWAEGESFPVFPTPATLAELEHERDLLPIQFSRQKSRYVAELAQRVMDGRLDLADVARLEPEAAIAALTAVPGIGRWTAEYCLMRAFGQRDVMPAGDGGLKQIIGRDYGYGRLATEAEIRAHGEAWAGWRGYAAFYWWHQLQQERRIRMADAQVKTL